MKIIFLGTPEFAIPTLQALAKSSHQVVLVVTGADKPRGRGQRLSSTAVKVTAGQFRFPIYQPERLRSPEVAAELKRYRADLFVVVAYRILPEEIIALPPQGVINLHASLLPKYRGAAPIQWALLNGEQETGVTTFFIEKEVDTGAMVLQRSVPIYPKDNAGDLHDRLALIGAQVVLETVDLIARGNPPCLRQSGQVTLAPKITKEMCRIDWRKPAVQIINQIRAFSPAPGAFTFLEERFVKIYCACKAAPRFKIDPGVLRLEQEHLFVAAGDEWLELLELQEAGKKRMTAAEFLRGHDLVDLQQFESGVG